MNNITFTNFRGNWCASVAVGLVQSLGFDHPMSKIAARQRADYMWGNMRAMLPRSKYPAIDALNRVLSEDKKVIEAYDRLTPEERGIFCDCLVKDFRATQKIGGATRHVYIADADKERKAAQLSMSSNPNLLLAEMERIHPGCSDSRNEGKHEDDAPASGGAGGSGLPVFRDWSGAVSEEAHAERKTVNLPCTDSISVIEGPAATSQQRRWG